MTPIASICTALLSTLLLQIIWAGGSHISVKAPFLSHCNHVQLETCEFIAASGGSVWDFLLDPEGWEQRLDAQSKELLSLSLRLRLHAPIVAIHASLEPGGDPQCNTYAWFEGEFYCNPNNLGKALQETEAKPGCIEEPPFGHVMGTCGPIVFVYSRTGAKGDFPKFHSILEPAAKDNRLVYVYRHLVEDSETCPEQGTSMDQVGLGYGLEVEISGHPKGSIKWEGLELKMSSPEGTPQNYTHLGHQAIEMVLTAKDPVNTLSLIAENVPLLMEHLKSVVPSKAVQERASALTRQMPSGEALISINNLQVFTGHFEMQSLTEFALAYKDLIDRFLRPVIEEDEQLNAVAQEVMGLMHSSDPIRYDVRPVPNAAIILNDLSSDKQYEAWPKTYASLMKPPTAQFYPLAKNIVVMVMFLDVHKVRMTLIEEIARMLEQRIPIQVILILADGSQSTEGYPTRCAALYSIYREHGRIAFIALLKRLAAGEDVQGARKAALEELGLSSGTRILDEGETAARDAALMFNRFGISASPTIFINGRPLEFREQGWPRDVIKIYQDEIYRLQMLIHNGEVVDDKTDYYAQLMDDPKVARSRHPDIDPTRASNYLSKLPAWASDKGGKKFLWLYSPKATNNCAYSVILKMDPRDVDHLEAWLRMTDSTERKMRLRVEIEESTSRGKELLAIVEDFAEKRISTKEAICRMQALRGPVQENPTGLLPSVVVNGNVYGPFKYPLTQEDLESLLLSEWNVRAERLQLIRLARGLERTTGALTAMTLFEGHLRSLLGGRFAYLFTGTRALELPVSRLNHFKVENPLALLKITAMMDPFSVTGAKIAALLSHTRTLVDAVVILNNRHFQYKHDFCFLYRFANPISLDPLLPNTQYSLQLVTPPTWSVLPRNADLDRLVYRPGDGPKVELLLDKLILEVDTMLNGRGQSGLPLVLSTDGQNATIIDQTVTITSRGYAQLAAPPGVYKVQPPSVEGLDMPPGKAVLASMGINKLILTGTTNDLLRSVQLGHLLRDEERNEDKRLHVLLAPETSKDAAQLIRKIIEGPSKPPSTFHFWIVANFLPLSTRMLLRQQLQQRASFTLLTYQWPAWLMAPLGRSNRMRALKTLFLDALPRRPLGNLVLAPNNYMSVSWDKLAGPNLDEHVWAMSPYCNVTAGYWQTAEWERFLAGKPYHAVSQEAVIIDAARFRERAVGERLRTEYHRQSYDTRRLLPHLDEILINRLAHDVPILSRGRCIAGAEAPTGEREEL